MRVIIKGGKRVAKITPQNVYRTSGPERRTAIAVLRKSLRAKRATGYRVGTITEDDKYGAPTRHRRKSRTA